MGKVKMLKCSFCDSNEEIDENTPICSECYDTFEKNQIPSFDLKEYFSGGLEKKLKEVDSLLFDLPESYFLWYLKGHLEHELGESKKAMRSINTSISYKQDFGDSWIRLGLVYSDMHRETDARENFKKGLDYELIVPSNLVDAGASLQASDQPKLAAKVLEKALELVPDDDRAMVTLAKVLVQTGELQGAKLLMDKALDLYPHNEEVLRSMAQVMMRMGDLDSAMEMYSRILDQHPRDFEALLAKGEIHLKLGELSQSLKSYKAVRDLDLHISWPGIFRFLISSLKNMLNLNKNQPSYRDDLKKEYENINLFLEELDAKVETAKGPGMLEEIESLIKVIENLRLNLKEQLGQFGDLLKKYKVEDSFHKHLRSKVLDLHNYIDQMRYFDGKQISLELSPFLSDLKSMDTRTESRLKQDIEKRFKELDEVGLKNDELLAKMDEIKKLESKGNVEGATFMLKEIQIALEEYWNDTGRQYFNNKLKEMEELLAKGKDQFDTARLERKLKVFKEKFNHGPKAVLDSYLDFAKAYSEDSENYYTREVDNLIKEIGYKITILDKESKDTKEPKRSLAKIENRLNDGEKAINVHGELQEILSRVSEQEIRQKISEIREKLMGLDKLLGDVDALGMDTEIAKNVEPVRRVIERSLKNENYRLADILTGEVYENVEKLLRENYIDDLKESMYDSLGEIERFRKLSVIDEEWDDLIDETKGVLEEEDPPGPLVPVVTSLAKIQTSIQDFFVERLPDEIDARLELLYTLLEEGTDYGFDLKWDEKVLQDLKTRAEEISSLEILEEAVSLEAELERKIRDLLSTRVKEINEQVRNEVEDLTERGATQKELMEILSYANRAEVLLESNSERDAFGSITLALEDIEKLKTSLAERTVEIDLAKIKEIINAITGLQLDPGNIEEEFKTLSNANKLEMPDRMNRVKELKDRALDIFNTGVLSIFDHFDGTVNGIIEEAADVLEKEEVDSLNKSMTKLEKAIRKGDIPTILQRIMETDDYLRKKEASTRKKALLSRCSTVIDNGKSIDDDRARSIVGEAEELFKRIRQDKIKDAETEIERLGNEISQLRSLLHIQDIENMLSEIGELDEVSSEIFKEIEGEIFQERIDSIGKMIKKLIDGTSALYDSPDADTVEILRKTLKTARSEIEYLENSWRAEKRVQSLIEMGLYEMDIKDRLLSNDLKSLKELKEKGDHAKFFRVWERIEGQMERIRRLVTTGGREVVMEEDKGMEILVRGKGKKRSELSQGPGKKGGMLGIQKLAKDMAAKRKLLEGVKKPEAVSEPTPEIVEDVRPAAEESPTIEDSETEAEIEAGKIPEDPKEVRSATEKPETEEHPMDKEGETPRKTEEEPPSRSEEKKENTDQEEDIAGIARLIAGDRIRKLEKGGSTSLEQKEKIEKESLPWGKDKTMDVKGLNGMVDEMMDMEVQPQTSTPMKNAERAKEKLESFYSKLPANLKLDESMALYARGISHMQNGDNVGALRQFRLAISSAVKMTRLHTEITKAISSLDRELSTRRKRGEPNPKGEKLYIRAEVALKAGNLAECATLIKEMKSEIFS